MATRITATEAARNFSDILNRVRYKGESFIIERSGDIVAELSPSSTSQTNKSTVQDLADFIKNYSLPDKDFAADVADVIKNQPLADFRDPWER